MSRGILRLAQPLAQPLIFIQKLLDSVCLVCEVHAQLLTFCSQVLHVLPQLISIQRELAKLLVLIGKGVVVVLNLVDLILSGGNHVNVTLEDSLKLPLFLDCSSVLEACEALHHAELVVVATQSQGQPLRLAIIREELLVLVTEMVDHVLVLLGAVSKYFKPFGCLNCPS